MEAELASLLGSVELVLPGRRQQLEVLDEAPDGDAEDGEREDDAGAAPAADAEGQVPEVVAVGLDVLLLLEESRKRSGRNSSGRLQLSGLLARYQALTRILLSAGMS